MTSLSSLLHYLLQTVPQRLSPAYRTIYIDLLHPDVRSIPGVLAEIQRQLGLSTPALTLTNFADCMAQLNVEGVRPLIAFDELEIFIRLPGEFSQDFCETLRAIASKGHIALLVASRMPLRQLHDQGALVSPLYNIMGVINHGPFTDDEAREFVTAPRSRVSFSEEQVKNILERGQ